MELAFVIWGLNPEILPLGPLSLRYYGLLFALGFICGYYIFKYFFKLANISVELLDKLLIYVALGTIIGARLGHILFYDPIEYLKNPLDIFKIWEGGLASHGGALGVVIALLLFNKKYKINSLWLLDRVIIVTALAGCFIRMGNLANSEIYGRATNSSFGFVYSRDKAGADILYDEEAINKIWFDKTNEKLPYPAFQSGIMHIEFDQTIKDSVMIKRYIESTVHNRFTPTSYDQKTVEKYNVLSPDGKFEYSLAFNNKKRFVASIPVWMIPRHPTQLYEAGSYFLIFIVSLLYFIKNHNKLKTGFIFGFSLAAMFTARFFIEMIKEEQVSFEKGMQLNMGQLLSIPFILVGLYFVYRSRQQNQV